MSRIIVVGGHGKVALHFARKAGQKKHNVVSLIRDKSHAVDIELAGAQSLLLSLEEASVEQLVDAFQGAQGVLFSAGAGGKGGESRTKAVDYEGAVKVFDAIERVSGAKPRLILVGAIDTRDMSKPAPSHYTEKDLELSRKAHQQLKVYYDWKLEADRNLVKRKTFPWTILRPGTLTDEAGTGKISLGQTGMGSISREDVASTLVELFSQSNTSGLVLDLIAGDKPVQVAVQAAAEKVSVTFESGYVTRQGAVLT